MILLWIILLGQLIETVSTLLEVTDCNMRIRTCNFLREYLFGLVVELLFIFSALKIHVSPSTKEVLDSFGTFELELRGEVEMKVCYKPTFYLLYQIKVFLFQFFK